LLPVDEAVLEPLGSVLSSANCIHEFQRYQILRWFLDNKIVTAQVVAFARVSVKGTVHERLVRPYALAYLGRSGELQDYETLQARYRDSENWLERLTIVCAMRGAPEAIRAMFYGRVAGEDPVIDRALAWAKKNVDK